MAAPTYHITMDRGADWEERFTVTNLRTGAVQDIASWPRCWFTAKDIFTEADPGDFQLTLGAGITFQPSGVVIVLIDRSKTTITALRGKTSTLHYDLQIEDPTLRKHKLSVGRLVVRGEVTQSP